MAKLYNPCYMCNRNSFICLGPRSSSIELKSKYMAMAIDSKFSRCINWENIDQTKERLDSKVISGNLAPNLVQLSLCHIFLGTE